MSDIEKSEASSFNDTLSSYQIGGGGPLSKQVVGLIFVSLVVHFGIKKIGFSDFMSMSFFHFLVVLPIFYMLYLIFNMNKPDEEA